MKRELARLKIATCSAIVNEGTSVGMLLDQIMILPILIDVEEHDEEYLTKHTDNLRESKSVPAVFDCLHFHWDYLHPDIYDYLITEFNLSSVSPRLATYQRELDAFLDGTLLKVFCKVEKMRKRHINPPTGFTKLVTEHRWNPPVYLRAVENFRKDFADYFNLR